MKTIQRFQLPAAALFAGLVLLFGAQPSVAQEKRPTPVIGIVDTDMLLEQSLAAKGVRLERDKFAATYQNQVKDMEGKLRGEDQELSQQRGVLAPDVFQQRATAFQQKLADFQTQVRDKQERLDFAFQQSMSEIGKTIMAVTQDVSKEKGVNVVLARNQMMIFDPGMDITQPVLEKLNQRLATVSFQNPDTLQRNDGAPAAAGAAAPAAAKAPAKK